VYTVHCEIKKFFVFVLEIGTFERNDEQYVRDSGYMDMGWVYNLLGWVGLGEEEWTHVHVWARTFRSSLALYQRCCQRNRR